MRRVLTLLAGVFFLAAVMPGWAQDQAEASGEALAAASGSQMECSGFLSPALVANDLYVDGGADNDALNTFHAFNEGDYVFLHIQTGSGPQVGQEYRMVRPDSESFAHNVMSTGLGPMPTYGYTDYYPHQDRDIHKVGLPYEDTGRVRIVKLTEDGVVAQVEFACTPLSIGDIAIPYEARPIPSYTPTANPDRFALTNGKLRGSIVAVKSNYDSAETDGIVYLDVGQSQNVQPGAKFRVVRKLRVPGAPLFVPPTLPAETVGEVVVLWTEQNSSIGIVVRALRDIDAGDAVQME